MFYNLEINYIKNDVDFVKIGASVLAQCDLKYQKAMTPTKHREP